ncbi:nicotinamide riboside transporter PnuC, partial [Glaesserella parasuis]
VAAQALMLLRYREQWLLWIALNILSIVLWAENPSMYIMYSAYLLNSLYGYYNWTKLQKA